MTERATIYLSCAALFVGLLGFLGVRVAQGQDPALGPKEAVAQVVPPRRVVVRKVVITKHITVIKPAAPATTGGATVQASAPASSAPTSTPAPAPTYTPAPAPAPAPAPVQSSTS